MEDTDVHDETEHVFDQTNGVTDAESDAPERVSDEERIRRRRESSALVYGMFGTGHQ